MIELPFFVFVLIVVFADYDPEFGMSDHMFNDLALLRDIMREYHSRIASDSSTQQLSVMVLQRSVWPFAARKKDVDLPPSVSDDGVPKCVHMNSGLYYTDASKFGRLYDILQDQTSMT